LSDKHRKGSGILQTEGLFVLIGMQLGDVAAERIAALVGAPAVAAVVDIFSGEMHRLQMILHLEKASNFQPYLKISLPIGYKKSLNFSPK
jgi:hypothetical protein